MMFKITIEKVETVHVKRNEWRSWSEDYAAELKAKRQGTGAYSEADERAYQRGGEYVPVDSHESRQTTILQQTVDSLDLAAVIRAVNGL